MQGLLYFIQESWKKPSNAESDKLSFSISVCFLKSLSKYLVSLFVQRLMITFLGSSLFIYNFSIEDSKFIIWAEAKWFTTQISLTNTECVIFKTTDDDDDDDDDDDELFLGYGWLMKGI